MLSRVFSAGLKGIDAYLVEVEVDISMGLANWNTVGLPESTVRESRERVIGAIRNSGFDFHRRRVTINLAPANVRKGGTAFDLAIALGLLASSGLFPAERLRKILVVGELTLVGELRPVAGVLSIAMLARRRGMRLIVPEANLEEATIVRDLCVDGVRELTDLVHHFADEAPLPPPEPVRRPARVATEPVDFSEVKGQALARRALEIAAAGGHNLVMVGPPGTGKTMLARRFPTILPPLTEEEAIETTRLYSAAGQWNGVTSLLTERPFRAPHPIISDAGMAGIATPPRPGEVSLAHNGVLFLDEFPEFRRNILENMRQPLESGRITIVRGRGSVSFPSRFALLAAMNPCPCGWWGSQVRECECAPTQIRGYRGRLSGPLLDRIDLQIEVPALRFESLEDERPAEGSGSIRARVLAARQCQQTRFAGFKVSCNAGMGSSHLRQFACVDAEGRALMRRAVEKIGLSARSYDRILKVARTIADLAASERVAGPHIAEALQYRALDRMSGQ